MGLLDDFSGFVKTPEGQGLLAAVAGGLAGARRGTPLNNIGRAGVAGLTGYANANEQINQDALRKLQNEQLGLSVSEMKRKQEADAQAREVLKGIYGQQGLPQSPVSTQESMYQLGAPAIAKQPQIGQTASVQGAIPPKSDNFTAYKTIGDTFAKQGLVDHANQYYAMAEKFRPKFKADTRTVKMPDGSIATVMMSEDGTETISQYTPAEKLHFANTGGAIQGIDQFTGKPLSQVKTTMSPDAIAADARSREQFAFNKSQAGSKWQYDAGSDQWVRPPSAENPLGTVTPNAGKVAALRNIEYLSNQFTAKDGILDKSTQGGVMGLSGSIGRVVNSQSAREFDNAKEQMSTEMRKIFRIPGEGAMSDKEQAQYGIQLPDVKNSPDLNRKIINDLIARSRGSAFPENAIGSAKQLPDNPSAKNLVKGEPYTLPNGQIGVWDGMGFKGK